MGRINELNEKLNRLTEAAEPRYTSTMQKGKTYLAWYVAYEGHSFYLVPNGTKLSDFERGGKFFDWRQEESHKVAGERDGEGPDFIMTVKDV